MARSIFVQHSAARKCDCGAKVQPRESGIAGEYHNGKWRRIGGFCPACVVKSRARIRADIPLDTTVQPRAGYASADTATLITVLRAALGVTG